MTIPSHQLDPLFYTDVAGNPPFFTHANEFAGYALNRGNGSEAGKLTSQLADGLSARNAVKSFDLYYWTNREAARKDIGDNPLKPEGYLPAAGDNILLGFLSPDSFASMLMIYRSEADQGPYHFRSAKDDFNVYANVDPAGTSVETPINENMMAAGATSTVFPVFDLYLVDVCDPACPAVKLAAKEGMDATGGHSLALETEARLLMTQNRTPGREWAVVMVPDGEVPANSFMYITGTQRSVL